MRTCVCVCVCVCVCATCVCVQVCVCVCVVCVCVHCNIVRNAVNSSRANTKRNPGACVVERVQTMTCNLYSVGCVSWQHGILIVKLDCTIIRMGVWASIMDARESSDVWASLAYWSVCKHT